MLSPAAVCSQLRKIGEDGRDREGETVLRKEGVYSDEFNKKIKIGHRNSLLSVMGCLIMREISMASGNFTSNTSR